MDPQNGNFTRCGKHPSQLITGICTSCLMERLSSVNSADPCSDLVSCLQDETVEICAGSPDADKKHTPEVRLRKTLLLLFQLDDGNGAEENERLSRGAERPITGDARPSKRVGVECPEDFQVEGDCSQNDALAGNSQFYCCGRDKDNALDDKKAKPKGMPFWLSSMLPRTAVRWSRTSSHKEKQLHSVNSVDGQGSKQLGRKPSLRYSFDWRLSRESSRCSWELPRHSWDGSMVSKAMACSFACLDERQDSSRRRKRSMMHADDKTKSHEKGIGSMHADVKSNGSSSVTERSFKEQSNDESCSEISFSGIAWERSHRWSKALDRSITSPLRGFIKKNEHVLARSLSESRKDSWKGKKAETAEADFAVEVGGASSSSARANHERANRIINSANGDVLKFRPDRQKKRECRFGSSRSVHYSSPGNLDNGLLRFYLTPLRSTRSTSMSRRKDSCSFARGILGIF